MARSLLRVRAVELPPSVAPADRLSALRGQALAWQPFEDAEVVYGHIGSAGLCLAWDRSWAADQLLAAQLTPEEVDWLPEPLLTAAAPADGCRLLRCREGVEAQVWRDGILRASRWWPRPPDEREWQDFSRVGIPGGGQLPLPRLEEATPAAKPWLSPHSTREVAGSFAQLEGRVVYIASLLLLAASVPFIHEAWALSRTAGALRLEATELSDKAASVQKVRAQAMALNQSTRSLVQELQSVSPLDVMNELAQSLPKEGAVLKEFDLDGTTLRLTLELAPGVSRSALVERLQATGVFAGIVEQRTQGKANWVAFSIDVSGLRKRLDAATPPVAGASGVAVKGGGA